MRWRDAMWHARSRSGRFDRPEAGGQSRVARPSGAWPVAVGVYRWYQPQCEMVGPRAHVDGRGQHVGFIATAGRASVVRASAHTSGARVGRACS